MKVRDKKRPAIHKTQGGQPTQKPMAQGYSFPAPMRGWIQNENLSAVRPGGATKLDNWICTMSGVRVRGGCVELSNITDPVRTLMTYRSTGSKLFAATDTGIYEASNSGVLAVGSLTSGDFSSVQFGTAGGSFMYAVNGSDEAQLFDGAVWQAVNATSTPHAITGVDTSTLNHAWTFASRIWFVEQGTQSAWYLDVGNVSGTATEFSLASVFTMGGSLLFGATWSLDAGDGLDDKCVFVSTEGEVVIYEGTDPGSIATWSKVGRYEMPKPLGRRAHVSAGGDLLIATESGLIPISAALKTDIAALEAHAVSQPIYPYWQDQASRLSSKSWEIIKDATAGVMFVSQPDATGAKQTCLAANLISGAWSRMTGWDVQCLAEYEGRTYFGSLDGGIYLADEGGSDNGAIFTATYLGLFESLGAFGVQKSMRQLRPVFTAGTPIAPRVGARADYDETLPHPPEPSQGVSTDVWDSAIWDSAVWDSGVTLKSLSDWYAAGVTGTAIAPFVQISSSGDQKPVVELVSIDAQYTAGAVVA